MTLHAAGRHRRRPMLHASSFQAMPRYRVRRRVAAALRDAAGYCDIFVPGGPGMPPAAGAAGPAVFGRAAPAVFVVPPAAAPVSPRGIDLNFDVTGDAACPVLVPPLAPDAADVAARAAAAEVASDVVDVFKGRRERRQNGVPHSGYDHDEFGPMNLSSDLRRAKSDAAAARAAIVSEFSIVDPGAPGCAARRAARRAAHAAVPFRAKLAAAMRVIDAVDVAHVMDATAARRAKRVASRDVMLAARSECGAAARRLADAAVATCSLAAMFRRYRHRPRGAGPDSGADIAAAISAAAGTTDLAGTAGEAPGIVRLAERAEEAAMSAAGNSPDPIPYAANAMVSDDEDFQTNSYKAYLEKLRSRAWKGDPVFDEYGFTLPGMGTSRKSCQNYFYKGCKGPTQKDTLHPSLDAAKSMQHDAAELAKGTRKKINCGRLSCLKCLLDVINVRAHKITEHHISYHLMTRSNIYPGTKRVVRHDVISPGPDEDVSTPKKFSNWARRVYRMLNELGIKAGTLIPHMYRFTKDLEKPYWSPHAHILSAGWTEAEDVAKNFEKTGMVFTNIKQDGGPITTADQIFSIARYLLTHCGQMTGENRSWHAIRHFGRMQNRYIKTKSFNMASVDSEFYLDDFIAEYLGDDTKSYESQIVRTDRKYDFARAVYGPSSSGVTIKESATSKDEFDRAVGGPKQPYIDNPAKPESATMKRYKSELDAFADSKIKQEDMTYDTLLITRRDYKGKFHAVTVFLPEEGHRVCKICTGTLHMLIAKDGQKLPNDILTSKPVQDPDTGKWKKPPNEFDIIPDEVEYVDPSTMLCGMPYFLYSDGVDHYQYETTLRTPNEFFRIQPRSVQIAQCKVILKSLPSHLVYKERLNTGAVDRDLESSIRRNYMDYALKVLPPGATLLLPELSSHYKKVESGQELLD